MTLHVPSYGGGVVRAGSPNLQRTDEVREADSLDIGLRGQLAAASDVSNYVTVQNVEARVLKEVWGLADIVINGVPLLLVVGRSFSVFALHDTYEFATIARDGASSPQTSSDPTLGILTPPVAGVQVTVVQFPGTFIVNGARSSVVLICVGAREGAYPRTGLGVYAYCYNVGASTIATLGLSSLDGLGTGPYGETFPTGTHGKDLFFRGIVGYNNHVFGWGFDDADATNGDGPARVMFSNAGDPRKWGNDNVASSGDRVFTDSDAIVLGDAGEIIRGALKWNGRLYFGTNQQLHYIAGYGRDSYVTDGANPVAKSYNVVGPNAMIEGPDKALYQVSDQGLVRYDGSTFEPLFKKLVDFGGHSSGWWDLIWTDTSRSAGYPGKTNQDLVWTAVDWDREQVVVGIPFCNASSGAGFGADTVVIKFHTRSGGFTRQVFTGVAFTAAGYFRREGQQREVRMLATATAGKVTLQRYGYQAAQTDSPILPTALPRVTFGPYAPFGPDGAGSVRRLYLTLAWESTASLPLVFTVTIAADESPTDTFTLTVGPTAPVSPAVGDVWLDTSQTDTGLGNATAGASGLRALGGFLSKTWRASAVWSLIAGSGEAGTRASIPIPITRRKGTRITVAVACVSAAGRFQFEGLGLNPGGGEPNA